MPLLQYNDLLFADDFVGLSDSKQGLENMINVVHAYGKKWCSETTVRKKVRSYILLKTETFSENIVLINNGLKLEWKISTRTQSAAYTVERNLSIKQCYNCYSSYKKFVNSFLH